jgi:Bifunctional DNA primase/polymerase, N-terminal
MTRPPADRSHLDAALGYAARGILVLPLHYPVAWSDQDGAPGVGCSCGDPACGPVGKHPMTVHGLHDATTSRARVEWWWRRFPQANIGLATGHQCDVLDIDGPDGEQAIAQLSAGKRFGAPSPVVRTGRGGWHVYLAPTGLGNPHPRGLEQVDWRGRGGYVVAPPSRHASGTRYRWVRDLDTPIPQVPAALRERLEPPTVAPRPAVPTTIQPVTPGHPYGQRVLELRLAEVAHAPKGQRNHTLYRAGLRLFSLAAGGVLDRDQVEAGLLAAAEHSGLLADEPTQTRNTISSAAKLGSRHPAGIPARDRAARTRAGGRPPRPGSQDQRPHGREERERDG